MRYPCLPRSKTRRPAMKEFKKIWLSVLGSNEQAINFYSRSGFEKIGDHDFQIGKEHFKFIAMMKSLK